MTSVTTGVSADGLRGIIKDALTAGSWVVNVEGGGYDVLDLAPSGEDSIHISTPSDDELQIRVGLNWDDSKGAFVHPDPPDANCGNPTFPGEIWSQTTTLGGPTGAVTQGVEWVAWHGRDSTEVRVAATPLARDGNDYQSFPETVSCSCNAENDPVSECDGPDDTYTVSTTGYRGLTYGVVLARGGSFEDTFGTISGAQSDDIRTTPGSARLGDNEYGRDTEWVLEDHNESVAGTHDRWIASDDDPVNLSDRGTFDANGTYTAPKPSADDCVFID